MSSETRASVVLCLGVSVIICQHMERFNVLELLMTCLSCIAVFLFSFTSQKIGSESLSRISEDGLPCSMLLPLISMVSSATDTNSLLRNLFQNGLILTSLVPMKLSAVHPKKDNKQIKNFISQAAKFGHIVSFACWFVILFTTIDLLLSTYIILLLLLKLWLQSNIPNFLPKCFTFGELCIVCQACSTMLLNFILRVTSLSTMSYETSSEVEIASREMVIFSEVTCVSCIIFILIFVSVEWFRQHSTRSLLFLSIGFLSFTYAIFDVCASKNFFYWSLQIIIESKKHIVLLVYWFSCASVAIAVSVLYQPNTQKSEENVIKRSETTQIRKVFHLLISLVFIPGLLSQPELLFLASVVALLLLVWVEMLRYFNIPPIGEAVRRTYSVFLDDQDKGSVVLTPIYLLIGCSSSLWLSIGHQLPKIISLAGVTSLGIGDSAASFCGSKYGSHHWRNSQKTIEGTFASIAAQLLFVVALELLGFHVLDEQTVSMWRVTYVIILTSLLEAFTSQIDNLILPLFMYLLLL